MKPPQSGRIVPFRPSSAQLLDMIRVAAEDSRTVKFALHALERMEERGITTLDALRVLQRGEINGDPQVGKNAGEWKCKIVKQMKGSRDIGVVTVVMSSGRLFVITVEWEDL